MYSNAEVTPRGVSYAAARRRAYDLQTVHDEEAIAREVIAAAGRLTQRALTNALAINLVAAEVQPIDADRGTSTIRLPSWVWPGWAASCPASDRAAEVSLILVTGCALVAVCLLIWLAYRMFNDATSSTPPDPEPSEGDRPSEALADEIRRLCETESELERVCKRTQDAIIRRAIWRSLRPCGGDQR